MTSRFLLIALATAAAASGQAPATPQGFQLNEVQQAYLDQVLSQWEARSSEIATFQCEFTRWVYDPVFGPKPTESGEPIAKQVESGEVSYQRPDRGSFQISKIQAWDAAEQRHVENSNLVGEHWVCDGQSIYQYNYREKQLEVQPIPPEQQGQNITDGPLPFLFGAKADQLKARYWMRVDPRAPAGAVWLHAAPKRQQDAANYRLVEIMLDTERMLPRAMRVTAPDGSRTTYQFQIDQASVNSRMTQVWNSLFQAPRVPIGWKKVQIAPPTATAAQPGAVQR
ncbi:TIGR03009 domain-containing protein [Botrimarina sp.]|uniref:TIGR03009 domain-containing protein n=1 Tax=Botrimarina sp. TaxID=2795802 RepID=UPI0032EE127A